MATKKPPMSLSFTPIAPPGTPVVNKVYQVYDTPSVQSSAPDTSSLYAYPNPNIKLYAHCISVRHPVFILEQACPLPEEIDADDARSWHFLAYDDETNLPVATLRVVPGPHAAHPLPGSVDGKGGESLPGAEKLSGAKDQKTKFHDGREPYVKIGRVATLKEARGRGVGGRLLEYTLKWMKENKSSLSKDDEGEWNGLVMVHSQRHIAPVYQKVGFEIDEQLGEWVEVGISHVAMWKRLKL